MNATNLHQAVLHNEALASLAIAADGIYIDGTFGRGGHARSILAQLNAPGRLIAMDSDPAAIEFAHTHFSEVQNFSIHHSNFAQIGNVCEKERVLGKVNGVLLDLGVSSPQLDEAERGFSFSCDGPLDMRMDTSAGVSAKEWLASVPEAEMADVFWRYGEERYSRRIARALVRQRAELPFATTLALAEAVKTAHPKWERSKHPATRVFQAIRIFINRELDVLNAVLAASVDVLATGGRLVVISFHSLEDRIVKRFFRGTVNNHQRLRGLPIAATPSALPLRVVGKKIKPSAAEVNENPRARSAILRVAEKVA